MINKFEVTTGQTEVQPVNPQAAEQLAIDLYAQHKTDAANLANANASLEATTDRQIDLSDKSTRSGSFFGGAVAELHGELAVGRAEKKAGSARSDYYETLGEAAIQNALDGDVLQDITRADMAQHESLPKS